MKRIITFLLYFSCVNSFATELKYEVRQITNSNGLSHSSINTIFQDSENLLWIGTWDGLNCYNGYDITIFNPELKNENSLSNQVVLKIIEDQEGYVWVLTMNGINRYDKKTKSFKSFLFTRKDKPPLSETEFHLTQDNQKTIFCAAKEWGIGYYRQDSMHNLEIGDLSSSSVKKIDFSLSGIFLVQYESGLLIGAELEYNEDGIISVKSERTLTENVEDFINFTDNELLILKNNGQLWKYSFQEKEVFSTGIKGVHKLIGRTGNEFVLSGTSGTFLLNKQVEIVNESWLEQVNSQKISTVFEGNEGILWIGTDGDGIFKLFPRQKLFHSYTKTQIPELGRGNTRSFCETPDNSFWVGTKGQGLFRFSSGFNSESKRHVSFRNYHTTNSLLNNSVYSLFCGQDSLLFIGTDGNGLSVFDFKYEKIVNWQNILGSTDCIDFSAVYSIFQDSGGTLWLGTNGYGMIRCRITREGNQLKITDFEQYLASREKSESLSSNIIFSIIPENEDNLWIGTRLGGLNLFNKNNGNFKVFRKTTDDLSGLSNNDILCLHKDSKGRLWIGTSLGLNCLTMDYDSKKMVIKSFTVNDGLPNNTIHGIVSDKNGNLWISTNFGISQFIVNENRFRNFTENDGLQNNEFADGAFYVNKKSGMIFMGGINGFNYFKPFDIGEYTYVPNIMVYEIKGQYYDKPLYHSFVVPPDFNNPPSVILKHNQNFFNIELAALSYINSEKCQYAYQLVNFDKDWNSIQTRRNISFTNVPPGEYSLWLKWSNGDGIWSEPVHAINFKIKPVFWQSPVAMVIYFSLSILLIVFIHNYYKKRQLLRQSTLLREREERMHQNRLTFFTDVAHEFQTPLTLITGPSQKLAESPNIVNEHKKYVNLIQRNANRLLFLVQQLLDFRKAEFGYLEANLTHFNLVHLIEQIAELFDELAIQKKIDYKIKTPSELVGWFDQDKIEKILFNLLSNAFKYTPDNGKIKLVLKPKDEANKDVVIVVSNTGKGISEEKIKYLFDRFFISNESEKAGQNKFRTGIGLAYTKTLVNVLKGTIDVKSAQNQQTTFTITLPATENSGKHGFLVSQVVLSDHLQNILADTFNETKEIPEKISAIESYENKNKTVLIVEDERDVHILLYELLKNKYRIKTSNNGLEAMKIIEEERPDIVISDVMMPVMDGIELCKKIKDNVKTCHIPVILLTAKSSVFHKIEGLESGANAYISKPFHPKHLEVRVHKLIEERERITKYFVEDSENENISALPIGNNEKEFINKVIELIKNNINNPKLQAAFLENELGMSSSQLYRKIKQVTGFSPGDMIRTVRLKYAAKLLRTTSLTVTEVFYQSGFNNRSYFYREFQNLYKLAPKKYQLKYSIVN